MKMKITPELLERYELGKCTPEEQRFVEEWLDDAGYTPDDVSIEFSKGMSDTVWKNVSAKIGVSKEGKVIPLHRRITRYAAALTLLGALSFSVYYLASSDLIFSESQVTDVYQIVQTKRGEKRTVTLPDGSTIRMNYETEIKVPEKFEGDKRIVYLTGHAHFDVTRNPEKPFIIYTEDTKTQVLGTSFDINTKERGETEIIVTSGKVAFSEKDKEDNAVTLEVNDRALLRTDNRIQTSKVDAQLLTAWKENRLVFNNQSLREIIKVLEPWYDVQILVEDPELLDEDFKLSRKNPPLETLLKELSFAAEFNYSLEGDKVIISK
ncbi:MAG: FecR domain-containing protein [Bacteroidota bacterium]